MTERMTALPRLTEDESNSTTLPRPKGRQRMMHTPHERCLMVLDIVLVFPELSLLEGRRGAYEVDGDPNQSAGVLLPGDDRAGMFID